MASEANKSVATMAGLIVVAAVIVGIVMFFFFRSDEANVTESVSLVEPEQIPEPPITAPPIEAKPVYEAPEPEPQEEPLPQLGESDETVLSSLEEMSDTGVKLVVPEEVVRKFVRAINAAEEGKAVHEYRPIVSPAPPFKVERQATGADQLQTYRMSEENFERYNKYVESFTAMDPAALAANYKRYYPLLEEAFGEMGLKAKNNFHSVMINAIDTLLATPVIEEDITLVRPKVFYQYADPALEKLPPIQKLLLRMGPENAKKLKEHMQKVRTHLINQQPAESKTTP